ncbi:hypothetical protein [Aeromonas sp. Y311-2]|uniref:hypothetical protein n=1 Tax=Aeromonas TaxID=642 RepID=UPI0022E14E7A|nr:hypothetical protein [Aeromonas sp. Y311-2]
MSPINKAKLTEADIISKFLLPAVKAAGWDDLTQIRQEAISHGAIAGPEILRQSTFAISATS